MDNQLFIELRDKAYREIKKKGYYAGDQPLEAYITGIHSELSEVFEFMNAPGEKQWICYTKPDDPLLAGLQKPDGIYFEIADVVIRLLSYCGHMGYEQYGDDNIETDRPYTHDDIFQIINASHETLAYINSIDEDFDPSEIEEQIRKQGYLVQKTIDEMVGYRVKAIRERNNELRGIAIREFVQRLELFVEESSEVEGQALDLYDLIIEKMKYNEQRSNKHGGKRV